MDVIIHYKITNLANAPDEVFNSQLKFGKYKYHLVNNIATLKELINKYKDRKIIIHCHNVSCDIQPSEGVKFIIQYHSEPSAKVHLKPPSYYKKLVLNQYHCLLNEYKEAQPVRNILYLSDFKKTFHEKIKIAYFPSVTMRINQYYDKGYNQTLPILNKLAKTYDIKLEIAHSIPYQECLKRKMDAHIIIDECITGSFHKTTLEALILQAIPVVWIREALVDKHIELYEKSPPVVNTTISDLEKTLSSLIEKGKPALEELALNLNKEFLEYWTPEIIVNEFDSIYEDSFSSPPHH
jgi:hypothetical protein